MSLIFLGACASRTSDRRPADPTTGNWPVSTKPRSLRVLRPQLPSPSFPSPSSPFLAPLPQMSFCHSRGCRLFSIPHPPPSPSIHPSVHPSVRPIRPDEAPRSQPPASEGASMAFRMLGGRAHGTMGDGGHNCCAAGLSHGDDRALFCARGGEDVCENG
ncbi:hypothetical protein MPTK1_5g17370 [Marchantia polymorpha subsp. ruderalis]|uniref:Uncharacterized protein n=2 Tax=Marchantia polymorpha TaxID=3197 RepID=A0AAF6BJB9_MARPO|nr:hypothetical protein MARPO_0182s0012 [Marchantia polymorpha]BBN12103.1 hypothetical protein Mp_5g17370 [Marchantia polymorpha subsp. ruderalis]|eukprot:PTQ27830.1 hypothetical protein MARPO_0182s0012 [Marchantia polymorpha]